MQDTGNISVSRRDPVVTFHRDYYLDKKRDNETVIRIIPCVIIKLHTINEWDKALRRRGQI